MSKILFFTQELFIFLFNNTVHAQPGDNTRWALGWSADAFVSPILTENNSHLSPHSNMAGFMVWGEYYLPHRWNVSAGYYQTNISYGIAERTMEGLQVGVKKYFVNPDFIIQPYVSFAPRLNLKKYRDWTEYGRYINNELVLSGRGDFRNPRITCQTGAGLEIYIFSSVGIVAEYQLGMGIAGKSCIQEYPSNSHPVIMADKAFYHQISIGVKMTFPFRFTYEDGINLFEGIIDALLPD